LPLDPANRRIRTRTYGGVGGEEPQGSSYPDCAMRKRTAHEQAATILLPNCLTREGTGRAYAVPIGEKGPINRDFLVRYETRTEAIKRITKPLLYR
jgi:hypothetical protein